jgi:hypothetical protein
MLAWLAVLSEKFLLKSSSGEEIAGLGLEHGRTNRPAIYDALKKRSTSSRTMIRCNMLM